jgi:hypothetical protein
MFRLIKLAIYGLLGYFIYEFVRGLMETEGKGEQPGGDRALDRRSDRQNITGGGVGRRTVTAEPSGESVPHVVGRGVVSK